MRFVTGATAAALLAALVAVPTPSFAQQVAQSGEVSIDWPSRFGGRQPSVTVDLDQTLLKFATSFARGAASEAKEIEPLRDLIGQVHLLRVVAYQEVGDVLAHNERESARLREQGWKTVVRAREGEEGADVLFLPDGDRIKGMVVFASGGSDLAFVNIAGDFDPELLGKHFGALVQQAGAGKLSLEQLLNPKALEELLKNADGAGGGE